MSMKKKIIMATVALAMIAPGVVTNVTSVHASTPKPKLVKTYKKAQKYHLTKNLGKIYVEIKGQGAKPLKAYNQKKFKVNKFYSIQNLKVKKVYKIAGKKYYQAWLPGGEATSVTGYLPVKNFKKGPIKGYTVESSVFKQHKSSSVTYKAIPKFTVTKKHGKYVVKQKGTLPKHTKFTSTVARNYFKNGVDAGTIYKFSYKGHTYWASDRYTVGYTNRTIVKLDGSLLYDDETSISGRIPSGSNSIERAQLKLAVQVNGKTVASGRKVDKNGRFDIAINKQLKAGDKVSVVVTTIFAKTTTVSLNVEHWQY